MRRRFSYRELLTLAYRAMAQVCLFAIFVLIMGIENKPLLRPSRTAAVTYLIYVLASGMMTAIYGGFEIGLKKSKPIFYAVATATIISDLVAYVTLMIMNTNPSNNPYFRLDDLGYLVILMICQVILIRVFAYGGNALYFRLYPPKKTLIVSGSATRDTQRVRAYLETYKKQYKILMETSEENSNLSQMIPNYDLVVFVDVFGERRRYLTGLCFRKGVSFAFAPSIVDTIEMNGNYTVYDDKPMLEVTSKPLTLSQQVLKRIIDILFSLLGLIFISPIILIVAIAIKLDDGGDVFYRQERLTINGEKFRIIKFRTMKPNDNKTLATINDDRITKVGHVLRRLRLDELPQIINILQGDMSVVGPRPEQEHLFKEYEKNLPEFAYRLRVKAGLTGEAQIAGKYNTEPKDKLILDLNYIQNYSVWRDVKLMFQTVTVFFKKDSTEGIDDGAVDASRKGGTAEAQAVSDEEK